MFVLVRHEGEKKSKKKKAEIIWLCGLDYEVFLYSSQFNIQ